MNLFRRSQKYKTRLRMKNIEKTVTVMKDLFQDLNSLMASDHQDPEIKTALLEELESRLDQEEQGCEGHIVQLLAKTLKKYIENEDTEPKTEESLEESLEEEPFLQEDELTDGQEETEKLETVAEMKSEVEDEELWTAVDEESSDEELFEGQDQTLPEDSKQDEPSDHVLVYPGSTPFRPIRRVCRSTTFALRLSSPHTPTTAGFLGDRSSSYDSIEKSTFATPVRLCRSSHNLAQRILRSVTPSTLNDSVICLGTPAKPPVEVVTLDDTI